MKTNTTILAQIILVLFAVAVLALMLWFPNIEGRNVNSTLFEVYFKDPMLAYAYIASIPFFMGVYKVYKIMGLIRENKINSVEAKNAFLSVRNYALTIILFTLGGLSYSFIFIRGTDDIAGGVAMGLFVILASGVVALVANMFRKNIKNL